MKSLRISLFTINFPLCLILYHLISLHRQLTTWFYIFEACCLHKVQLYLLFNTQQDSIGRKQTSPFSAILAFHILWICEFTDRYWSLSQGEYGKGDEGSGSTWVSVCAVLDSSGITNDKHIRYIIGKKKW